MAKKKLTVESYLHYAERGVKMEIVLDKFGNDGYVLWHSLLEKLCLSPNHYLNLSDEDYRLQVAKYCRVDESLLEEFLDWITAKDWGMFSTTLWKEHKIIMSPKLTEQLTDTAYTRRKDGSKPKTEEELIKKYSPTNFVEGKESKVEINKSEWNGSEMNENEEEEEWNGMEDEYNEMEIN